MPTSKTALLARMGTQAPMLMKVIGRAGMRKLIAVAQSAEGEIFNLQSHFFVFVLLVCLYGHRVPKNVTQKAISAQARIAAPF